MRQTTNYFSRGEACFSRVTCFAHSDDNEHNDSSELALLYLYSPLSMTDYCIDCIENKLNIVAKPSKVMVWLKCAVVALKLTMNV